MVEWEKQRCSTWGPPTTTTSFSLPSSWFPSISAAAYWVSAGAEHLCLTFQNSLETADGAKLCSPVKIRGLVNVGWIRGSIKINVFWVLVRGTTLMQSFALNLSESLWEHGEKFFFVSSLTVSTELNAICSKIVDNERLNLEKIFFFLVQSKCPQYPGLKNAKLSFSLKKKFF